MPTPITKPNLSFIETVEQCREKAFAIAKSVSPEYLAQLSALVLNAIKTGATFDEFQAAARNLDNTSPLKSWSSIMPPAGWEVRSKLSSQSSPLETLRLLFRRFCQAVALRLPSF